MPLKSLIKCITIALGTAGVAACGGGSGGESTGGSATISSVGTLTGFGSVFVGGVEYETTGASYRVDDTDAFDDSALAVGMKVKVTGTLNADGVTGIATRIEYDDDIEGPVDTGSLTQIDADTKVFSIFGMQVQVNAANTVFDDGAAFDTLAEGQILEVSGYFDGTGFVATRIERQSDQDSEYELKGTVTGYDGATVTLALQNGVSAGPYTIAPGADLDIPADPAGQFVELKLSDQNGSLFVVKIETDDMDMLDEHDEDVSLHGVLTGNATDGYSLNGVPLGIDDSTEYDPGSLKDRLVPGMSVEAEGYLQNGVLVVEKIEGEDGDIMIEARVIDATFVTAKVGTVTLDMGNSASLSVSTDNGTLFEDKSASDLNDDGSFNMDELSVATDYVEVEAYRNDNGALVATHIERRSGPRNTRLEAPLDAFESGVSVTLLGITYSVNGATQYEVQDATTDAGGFFAALNTQAVVKVKDVQPDGSAEKVELED